MKLTVGRVLTYRALICEWHPFLFLMWCSSDLLESPISGQRTFPLLECR